MHLEDRGINLSAWEDPTNHCPTVRIIGLVSKRDSRAVPSSQGGMRLMNPVGSGLPGCLKSRYTEKDDEHVT